MPAIAPNQIAEVVVRGQFNGQAVLNVMHWQPYRADNPLQAVDSTLFLQGFRTLWRNQVLPQASTGYQVIEYYLGIISGRTPNPFWTPASPPTITPWNLVYSGQDLLAGAAADEGAKLGAALPTFVACGVGWLTENRKRYFRGSTRFMVGIEDNTSDNSWAAAYLTNTLQPMAAAFLPNIQTDGGAVTKTMSMCIFARRTYLKAANAPVPVLTDFASEVINYRVNPYVSSQVSRKQRLRLQ